MTREDSKILSLRVIVITAVKNNNTENNPFLKIKTVSWLLLNPQVQMAFIINISPMLFKKKKKKPDTDNKRINGSWLNFLQGVYKDLQNNLNDKNNAWLNL